MADETCAGERPSSPVPERLQVGRTVSDAVRICYSNPLQFIGMAALVGVPSLGLALLGMARDPENWRSPGQGLLGLVSLGLMLAAFVMIFYMLGSLPVLAAYALDGRSPAWTEGWSWLKDREMFWGVFLVILLYQGAALLGLLFLIVPGVYFGVVFMLAVPARVLGNLKGLGALRESRRMIRPLLFRGALDFAGVLFIPWAVVIIVQVAFMWKYGITSTAPARVIPPAVITYLISAFWTPVYLVAPTLHYIERSGGLGSLRNDLFT